MPGFAAATLIALAAAASAAAADFDGDGRADLVWRDASGHAVLWEMAGLTPASRRTLQPAKDAGAAIVGTGTFAGTGAIAWLDSTGTLSLWHVTGDAVAACDVATGIDPAWTFLGIGDIDRDGTDDFAWRLPDGSVEIFYTTGCSATTAALPHVTAGPDLAFAGIGTVDGKNGALFWRNGSGDVVLWRVRNGTVSVNTIAAGTFSNWSIAAIADFDGNGTSDVLWTAPDRSVAAVWLMDGTSDAPALIAASDGDVFGADDDIFVGRFDSSVQPASATSSKWNVAAAADVDGDGSAEIVLAGETGDVAIWQVRGSTLETTSRIAAAPDMPYPGRTGWRMPLARPVVTKSGGIVTVAAQQLAGAPGYTFYASPDNDPAATGTAVPSPTGMLAFARTAGGFADKRYFAASAGYFGVALPPSREAYIVEFTPTRLPTWGALALADVNRDGCIDILGEYGDCHGHFSQVGLPGLGLGALTANGRAYRDLRFADFNGDGYLDAVSNTYSCDADACGGADANSQLQLYFGNADGTFTQDLAFSALSIPGGGFGETIVIADFNNDGALDIFLPKYTAYDPGEHNFLLINDGSGHFSDAADSAGVAQRGVPLCGRPEGAEAVDINNDGWIDLYAASHLYMNSGVGTGASPVFADIAPAIDSHCNVVSPSTWGVPQAPDEGAKFIDYDNSGQLALALNVAEIPNEIRIFKFDGVSHFEPLGAVAGITLSSAWGFDAADADGDGLTDIVVAGGCDPAFLAGEEIDPACTTIGNPHALPQLLVNRAGQFVSHDFYDDGIDPTARGWQDLVGYADFDYSGTADFVARVDGGANAGIYVLMSLASSADTIMVTVLGPGGEQNQAGRVVRVSPQLNPGIVMTQVVDGGSGYMANGPYDLTFATPYAGTYTVSVRFAQATYRATARIGEHVTMRADGSYSIQ